MVQKVDSMQFEIVLVLLRNRTHLREIGRILGESHSTILRKVNELIDKNIIGAEQQGKNKVYSLKNNLIAKSMIYMAEKYKLLKLLKEYPMLSIILEEVVKKTNEKLIVVFGSYAKFSAGKDSDIDIYIETKNRRIKNIVKEIDRRLSVKIGFFDKDSLLIKEIIKNHVIVKGVEEFYEKNI